MDDAAKKFFELAARLNLNGDSPDEAPAVDFWNELVALGLHDDQGKLPLRVVIRFEEALATRVVMFRLQRTLGQIKLFRARKKGALEGISAMHPVVDALAKTHERMRWIMDDLDRRVDAAHHVAPLNYHQSILNLLKETDGVLAEALGFEPGQGGPLEPKFIAGTDRCVPGPVPKIDLRGT